MNVVGIIAEYNPFHNGHAYHIKQAKKLCHADACVIVMSPDFVQRGEPAIMSKYHRANASLLCGADCIFELPVAYATGAARTFAEAGVAMLDKLGIVTHLCFGSECGDITPLQQIADILACEPKEYRQILQEHMKQGLSFPTANQKALEKILGTEIASCAMSPNNLLAIEYLRALKLRHSSIIPITVTRIGNYNDSDMDGEFSSATAIRRYMADNLESQQTNTHFLGAMPTQLHTLLSNEFKKSMPVFPNDFSGALNHCLIYQQNYTQYEDVSPDLANAITKQKDCLSTYEALAEACKTKQYTRTRINRAILHILLNIQQDDLRTAQQNDYGSYIRILGFKESFIPFLSTIKQYGALSLITKVSQAGDRLNDFDLHMFKLTLQSSDLYRTIVSAKYGIQPYNEYTHGLIRIQ